MNLYDIEVEVHKKLANGAYRVKVKILNQDIGMYINGNRVFPPKDEHPNWSVLTPGFGSGNIVEFNGKSPLWKEYKQACIDAVQEYMRHERLGVADDMKQYEGLSQEESNRQILEDIENLGF